jgi:hypothetical protein
LRFLRHIRAAKTAFIKQDVTARFTRREKDGFEIAVLRHMRVLQKLLFKSRVFQRVKRAETPLENLNGINIFGP